MSSKLGSDILNDAKEREHFRAVVGSFKNYMLCSLKRIHKSEKMILTLPPRHQKCLDKYKSYLLMFKKCLDANNDIMHLIIKDVDTMFQNVDHSIQGTSSKNGIETYNNYCEFQNSLQKQQMMQGDVVKVQSVLKNIARDWSDVGALEREQCYTPILLALEEIFPPHRDRSEVKVLVPGAGLGRLAWEIAVRDFTCQGNEFSLFMLFASNFILNTCNQANQYLLYPWVHQYVNNLSCEHQMLAVRFPDESFILKRTNQNFSMTAGHFLEVYTQAGLWTCVVTCFFIDCAPNVIDFIERIYLILQPGGFWINLGPLLYHHSDSPTGKSIEPPYDILLEIIKDVGFHIVKEKTGVKTKYAQNPNSMMQQEYDSVFFVCQKPY